MKSFIKSLEQGQVPSQVPKWFQDQSKSDYPVSNFLQVQCRSTITEKFGMWGLVDMKWTRRLAAWIQNRRVLEIMAGSGWLAKALNLHGASLIATDDFSWDLADTQQFLTIAITRVFMELQYYKLS